MNKTVSILIILFVTAAVFAEEDGESKRRSHEYESLAAEIDAILEDNADTSISDLTFGQLQELLGRLSVPMQEAAYIQRSSAASMMMPGKGQFMNGDALSGSLFLAADLAVVAGTLVGTYFLLPAELQFDQLDYLNTSHTDIMAAWRSASV